MSTRDQEVTLKLREHLEIVDRILADWQERGRLDRYANEMIEWVLEFVILDIFSQEEPERTQLLLRLDGILAERFSDIDLQLGKDGKAAASLLAVVRGAGAGRPARKAGKIAMYRYYLERRGIRDCVSRALSGVFASGPLEALGRGIRKVLPTPASSMLRYVGELSGDLRDNRRTTDAVVMLLAEYESKKKAGVLCEVDKSTLC